eukprot:CAMPEP_0182906556 /NCGR_PEP_ID=MMETSP0034_2-20130328/33818_1 /TAXON_ID=156128 /ORGANISM="Nephroselmis pyriformis, Strain CCMP717" /LENGTH=226 /DNA_ID=CAMNT_0025042247 /DNA_START=102 /DNA_END=782 /DNA_ORIENTATION=-
MSLSDLYNKARRLTLELREGVEKLEASSQGTSYGASDAGLARGLREKQKELQRVSAEMDSMWRMQVVREGASKKDIWKRKVEGIGEESDSLRMALDKFQSRETRKQAEEKERAELLQRVNMDDEDHVAKGQKEFDMEAQEMASVTNSHRVIDDALAVGADVLAAMGGQRERLKSAHRKALDVLNNIGIGESLMRVVERRQRMDQVITYLGMIVTCVVVGFVWHWTH